MYRAILVFSYNGECLYRRILGARMKRQQLSAIKRKIFRPRVTEEISVQTSSGICVIHKAGDFVYVLVTCSGEAFLLRDIEVLKRFDEYLGLICKDAKSHVFVENFFSIDDWVFGSFIHGFPSPLESALTTKKSHHNELHPESDEIVTTLAYSVVKPIPWRVPENKYVANDISVEVLEKFMFTEGPRGQIVNSCVRGVIRISSRLNGFPECRFGFNEQSILASLPLSTGEHPKSIIKASNIQLHRCVQLNKFQHNHSICFVPPDGTFDLLVYDVPEVKPILKIKPTYVLSNNEISIDIKVAFKLPTNKYARNICLRIPVPSFARDVDVIFTSSGRVHITEDYILWQMKNMDSDSHQDIQISLLIDTPETIREVKKDKRPISADFTIQGLSICGVEVMHLRVMDRLGYKVNKWIRFVSQSGVVEKFLW